MTVKTENKTIEKEYRKHYCDICGEYIGTEYDDGYCPNNHANFDINIRSNQLFWRYDIHSTLCNDMCAKCNEKIYRLATDLLDPYFDNNIVAKDKLFKKIREMRNNK